MIAVDTSALMAIILDEAQAGECAAALAHHDRLIISAATILEALIVAQRRGLDDQMRCLIDGLGFEVINVDAGSATSAAEAYRRWGKGVHPAGLNFGDCFADEVAKAHNCPLLYVGSDFARTDLASALNGIDPRPQP